MASKSKPNGSVDKHNGHVSLAREEYDALTAREESYTEAVVANAKLTNQLNDAIHTCNEQTRRMAEMLLTVEHLKRINSLQEVFIEMIRYDHPGLASIQDLSNFWRQWTITTSNQMKSDKLSSEEVAKFEPDLFRTWRNWVNAAGKMDRTLSEAGRMTRAEYEKAALIDHPEERAMRLLVEENARFRARQAQLELEIESLRAAPPKTAR